MHYLLIQPTYYSRYPPLGLLKISSYFKNKGHTVEYIKGMKKPRKIPNEIFVTSLFLGINFIQKVIKESGPGLEKFKAKVGRSPPK